MVEGVRSTANEVGDRDLERRRRKPMSEDGNFGILRKRSLNQKVPWKYL